MDLQNVSSLLSGISQNQSAQKPQKPAIPGAPPQNAGQMPPPIPGMPPIGNPGNNAGTDFGPAGVFERTTSTNPEHIRNMNRAEEMWNNHQQQVDSFRQMIETLLNRQAGQQGLANGWTLSQVQVTDEMRAAAQESIDEGGYFSVENTAARMLNFAVAITGGDSSKIDLMSDAVQKGFKQAESFFGRDLPEISHKTLQAVMNGFDEWREAGSSSAISLLKTNDPNAA